MSSFGSKCEINQKMIDKLIKGGLIDRINSMIDLDANKLRSTIDYERDYKLISKVFREVRDPIQICSTDLTLILKKLS